MPSLEQKSKVNNQFKIFFVSCYIVKTDCHEEHDTGREVQFGMRETMETIPLCQGGKATNCAKIFKLPLDGRRTIVDTRIQGRLLTSHISRHGVSAQERRQILRMESMIRGQNQDRRNSDLVSHEHFARLQP